MTPVSAVRSLLSINNYHYRRGGAEVAFLEHNVIFADAGWNVVPFAMQHPANLPTPWSRFFPAEMEFGNEYSLLEKLRRVPRVIYSRDARRSLARLLDTQSFDVAHAHNIYHHLSPSILPLLKERGVPVIMTLHDLKLACPAYTMRVDGHVCERCKRNRVYNAVLHRCIKGSIALSAIVAVESAVHRVMNIYDAHVSRFVVPSRFLIDKLVEWGWQRERFEYIPNFVDTSVHQGQSGAGSAFLYVGRLSAEKGLDTLIRAAALARQAVVLVGTGPELERLQDLARTTAAPVSFAGFKSGVELHRLVGSARAVVLPSEWYENAPLTILEAYAQSRPVIGAAIGGIPEMIREGETGATFSSGDVASLAERLNQYACMSDAAVIEQGRAARDWVESRFSMSIYRERIEKLYGEVTAH